MSETLQRRFTMFLCLECSGELQKLNDEELAFALRISPEDLAQTKEVFTAKGFLVNGRIANWDKRQFISDNVNARVKRHRERRAAQGLPRQRYVRPEVKAAVFARDGNACVSCGAVEDLTLDHIVSELKGGTSEAENLQVMCRVCNASKRDGDNETFLSGKVTLQKRPQIQKTDTEKEKREPPSAVVVPGLDMNAWNRWVAYRKQIGKALKPVSYPAAMKAMALLGDGQMRAVEHTEGNGWTGLRAPDMPRQNNIGPNGAVKVVA